MKVELKDLREAPVDLNVDASPASLDLSDPEFRFPDDVRVRINFRLLGDRVLAKGPLSTTIIGQCVRCLTDVRLPLSSTLDAVYENDPELLKPERKAFGTDEQIVTWFDGESIHPEPEIRESLLLELPSITHCSEDCKGLCPVCGANLNEGPCKCSEKEEKVSPWQSALKNIKLENE